MKYTTERQKGSVKFTFTVPAAEWEEAINSAYIRTRNKYNIPGFRKGHAPRKFIESMYGPTVFFDDAFNTCASDCYRTALNENEDIFPVDEPSVDIQSFEKGDMIFTIEVTLKPDVTLGQYKGLEIETTEYAVTDKDVDDDIDRSRQAKSRLVDVTDRAAQDGDTVTIDYSGSVDGVKFNGGTAEKQDLVLGSHSFIPGFEEQVVGMKIGESKDLNVTFPEDYHAEDLKGKAAVFAVTLHAIKFREVPELTPEFVKDTTAFETVDEYKADVRKRLTENAEHKTETEKKNRVLEAVVKNATVEIPDCMIESELDYMLQDFEYRLAYMYGGMKLDDYFKYTGSSREGFRKDRKEEAANSVKTRLVVETLVKTEKIEVTDAELDERIAEVAKASGKTTEEYRATLDAHHLGHLRSDATVEKLFKLLLDATKFTYKAEGDKEPAKKPAAKKTASTAAKKSAGTAEKKTANGETKKATTKKPATKKPE